MFVMRATAKLLRRLGSADPSPGPSTGRLGDWYANILFVRPTQLVLAVSARTLLPVLLPAKPAADLPQRLVIGVEEMLRALSIPEEAIARELAEMRECRVAKTASRQVLGSMNDFAFMLEAGWREEETLLAKSLFLAQTPCSPIDSFPDKLTREVMGVQ